MMYAISGLSSFISGLGIGGGAVFILLSELFNLENIDVIRTYNLVLFVSLGITIIIRNRKNSKIVNREIFKEFFFIVIGCVFGFFVSRIMPQKMLKISFYLMMIAIGIYEVISCLINLKNGKNIIGKEWKRYGIY